MTNGHNVALTRGASMRLRYLVAPTAAVLIAAACTAPPQVKPVLPDPARCGQTTDGTAIVALDIDAQYCTYPGKRLILVEENCGPLMAGSNVVDDCYRGNITGLKSPAIRRLGTFQANGGYNLSFVASDATAI